MTGDNIFATGSASYASARPPYPKALFDWIAATASGHERAWDCATGNGQAAIGLAPHFQEVRATDISGEQVAEGFAAPNIIYSAQPAERTNFPSRSFDLIAVAQALHWFDYDLFWPEVRRVARPGALFCAWGYAWFRGSAKLDEALLKPAEKLIDPYWAANNRILWNGYRVEEVKFPFPLVPAPELRIEVDWSLAELIGYVRTWSAFKRASANETVREELERLIVEASQRLGTGSRHRLWVPLNILAGIVRYDSPCRGSGGV